MEATADATNSVICNEEKSIYLYHSMPLHAECVETVPPGVEGNRKFIPYNEVNQNIEKGAR
ncbi:hypothetical protein PybrP1_009998 [[Pythium] brassicae (nom. inval.)]|nr:hypothetical protein PybrP1_009998 [[Pythium] brassicae (nom. inval.)]